ncbi:hypothetical protein CRG98_036002 [Punica granatum]|uniref:Uncharacterized protein n=1 Tax=Punica granatum TaxID=22663 RepID=A0A2I0IJV4_PUNGR|nr:hypothetical protein CRG98_036002 [Punica granatum]
MAGKRVASSSLSAAMAAFRISSSSLKNCPAGRLLQAPLLAPRQPDRCVHPLYGGRRSPSVGQAWVRSCPYSNEALEQPKHLERSTAVGDGETKVKRKKLKGKRAVVRWLKFFRWKKKKEYERMTAEEKNLYKLRKALDKSKYRDGLRAVRKQIPRLEQELELLRAQAERPAENKTELVEDTKVADDDKNAHLGVSSLQMENSSRLKEIIERAEDCVDDESNTELGIESDSEDLSDIFETDSETEPEDKAGDNLYLDAVDKFPAHSGEEPEDFEDHLRQISMDSRNARTEKHLSTPNLDEVDRMFLRAASLLKKKRR